MSNWVPIYIGLGSNQGESGEILRQAANDITTALAGCALRKSRLYESAPVGGVQQPNFLNAAIALLTRSAAEDVLHEMLAVERAAGRKRSQEQRWGPRTLDLDLLLYGRQTIASETLTVPHPRLAERAFVLQPLADVAPDLLLPSRQSLAELLRATQTQEIRALEEAF